MLGLIRNTRPSSLSRVFQIGFGNASRPSQMPPPTLKRLATEDGSVSPPPTKRKVSTTITSKPPISIVVLSRSNADEMPDTKVANFFKPVSQKEPSKATWRTVGDSLLICKYDKSDEHAHLTPRKIAGFDFVRFTSALLSPNRSPAH